MSKQPLRILLANPRGFCAGVERAIEIVERALAKYGTPVFVRHEIVHNRYVVEGLQEKGAVFVEELEEVPDNVPVIFSAHGVPKSVPTEAKRRELEDEIAAAQSVFPRAEDFGVHDLIDPRRTRPLLCDWIDEVAPLLEQRERGPRRYTMRP